MSGPLAQSAERGADNAKVVSSSLTRTIPSSVFYNFLPVRKNVLKRVSLFLHFVDFVYRRTSLDLLLVIPLSHQMHHQML